MSQGWKHLLGKAPTRFLRTSFRETKQNSKYELAWFRRPKNIYKHSYCKDSINSIIGTMGIIIEIDRLLLNYGNIQATTCAFSKQTKNPKTKFRG